LLERHGTLTDLMGLELRDLMAIKGIKEVRATKIAATFEIARRILKRLESQ
jgi:DNA repair protein RadC